SFYVRLREDVDECTFMFTPPYVCTSTQTPIHLRCLALSSVSSRATESRCSATDNVANVIIAGFPRRPSPAENPVEIVIITVNFDSCFALPLLNPVASESTSHRSAHDGR